MAATYYLVGVMLLLAVVVSGQGDTAPLQEFFQQELAELKTNIGLEAFRPLMEIMNQNPFLCNVCESVIGFLKNVTEDQTTLAELVKVLLPVCDWAPFALHQECITAVEGIPALVKQYADQYLDPEVDCAYLCKAPIGSKTNSVQLVNKLMQMMKAKEPVN